VPHGTQPSLITTRFSSDTVKTSLGPVQAAAIEQWDLYCPKYLRRRAQMLGLAEYSAKLRRLQLHPL
jgi:hypothetical protein